MNTEDFQSELKGVNTVIIPAGAYEVWGPHLPIGSDTLIAQEIASRLADRMGWMVGPTLPVGDSTMVWGPGTLTVRPESFKMYLEDICESLVRHGIKRFCFVSPHVANLAIISQVAWKLKLERDIDCCVFDWWRIVQPVARKLGILDHDGVMAHGHASEAGTSCFMYLRPDLVKQDRLKKVNPGIVNDYPEFQQFVPFSCYGDDYMLGDATCASAAKGKALVEATLDRMVEFLEQWNPPRDKYKSYDGGIAQ
nr:creatininase family protein [Dethiosulfovibrio faecalis]